MKNIKYERVSIWDVISKNEKVKIDKFAEDYKDFLTKCKTERETVDFIIEEAMKHGFSEKSKKKFFVNNRGKAIALVIMGKEKPEKGVRIIGSHIDAPRIDIKPNPFYEDSGISLMKTHYYGGIKKYQWVSMPLALRGLVVTTDGKKISIAIGDNDDDPVFVIPDLLPHLARKVQGDKKLFQGIEGEQLNVVVGTIPVSDKKIKDRIKTYILEYLYKTYKIKERDFNSAEIEIVPAGKAKDVGFDRSMIGGYGHDDRVCAYTSLRAIFDIKTPQNPVVALFMDKEEIGSAGNTGAQSRFLEDVVMEIVYRFYGKVDYYTLRKALNNSIALSSDVNAVVNPSFKSVHDINNAALINHGVVLTKYTGAGGKSGANDAPAEFVALVRKWFERNKVVYQMAELGKVDEGGGGTIAKFMAHSGVEVIDCGTGVLGMHSPFEVIGKGDLYMTYKGYHAFYKEKR